jgi:hypothetical protein
MPLMCVSWSRRAVKLPCGHCVVYPAGRDREISEANATTRPPPQTTGVRTLRRRDEQLGHVYSGRRDIRVLNDCEVYVGTPALFRLSLTCP